MTMLCRVCGKNSALPERNVCSTVKCQEEISQAENKAAWFDLELQECQASLTDLESGRYMRTYVKFLRVEALVKAMSLGVSALKRRFKKPRSDVHLEIQEWQAAQYTLDRESAREVRNPLKRLKRKLRVLEKKLSLLEEDWRLLDLKRHFLKVKLDDALKVLGE